MTIRLFSFDSGIRTRKRFFQEMYFIALYRKTAGKLVPAEVHEGITRMSHKFHHRHRTVATAGAFDAVVLVLAPHKYRPFQFVQNFPRYQPEHSYPPGRVAQNYDRLRLAIPLLKFFMHLAHDLGNYIFSFIIYLGKMVRESPRLRFIFRRQKFVSAVRAVHPRGGVEPGTYHKYNIVLRHISLVDIHFRQKLLEPRTPGFSQEFHSQVGQGPVLSRKRHHIREGGEPRHVEHPFFRAVLYLEIFSVFFYKALHEFKYYSRAAKHFLRIIIHFGIQYGISARQNFMRQMMVCDYYVHAVDFRLRHFFHRCNAEVYGNDKLGIGLLESPDSFQVEPVAFGISFGNIDFIILIAQELQEVVHYYRSGYSVAVVIRINDYFLFRLHRLKEPDTGTLHIPHEEWVVQIALVIGV